MKRKPIITLILLTLLFSFSLTQIAQAQPPETLQEAVALANKELGWEYFKTENKAGKPLNFIDEVITLSSTYICDRTYGVLVYGDPHGDKKNEQSRYLGYTKDDEDFTNPGFPHDVWGGGYLEDRDWIEKPWKDDTIKRQYGIRENNFDGDPKTLERIQMGIAVYYATVSKGGNSPYWQNWHEYVHILVPQTEYTWGMGRMWHKLSDGRMFYITIPIAPGALELNTRNLAVKDLKINPNPAEEGDAVTVSANITSEGKEAENTLVQYRFHGNTVEEQNITVPAKGSVPVSFNITAPPAGKYSAGMVVNPNKDMPPDEANILNGDWPGDNIAWDWLQVKGANLAVQIATCPDKAEEGETVGVTARVTNESGDRQITRVVWKLNGNVIKDETDFSVTTVMDTAVTFTMPKGDANISVEVNPDKNVPPNETVWDDNRDSRVVKWVPKQMEASGNLTINAPDKLPRCENDKKGSLSFNFTVKVTTRIPEPYTQPGKFPPPKPVISLKVWGDSKLSGGNTWSEGLWGDVINMPLYENEEAYWVLKQNGVEIKGDFDVGYGDKIFPPKTYTADWGTCTKTFTYKFPFSGMCENTITSHINARADCDKYNVHLTAKKNVINEGWYANEYGVGLTQ